MFGYVTACKMELKVKDYEKYKAYYCGLCKAIKKQYGNLPRLVLNYDMTFLAVLLDSLEEKNIKFKAERCFIHPSKKRMIVTENKALDYAAFSNVALAYYKLLDNVKDDKELKSKFFSVFLGHYLKGGSEDLQNEKKLIENNLNDLSILENFPKDKTLDQFSHVFAELTAHIITAYIKNQDKESHLYKLGYNLGKWIYIIDALDDLEEDMKKNKFNAINSSFNKENLPYAEFLKTIQNRIDFVLVACASKCASSLKELQIMKNKDLLENILQYGLMEKMDKVFKRSVEIEKPI